MSRKAEEEAEEEEEEKQEVEEEEEEEEDEEEGEGRAHGHVYGLTGERLLLALRLRICGWLEMGVSTSNLRRGGTSYIFSIPLATEPP